MKGSRSRDLASTFASKGVRQSKQRPSNTCRHPASGVIKNDLHLPGAFRPWSCRFLAFPKSDCPLYKISPHSSPRIISSSALLRIPQQLLIQRRNQNLISNSLHYLTMSQNTNGQWNQGASSTPTQNSNGEWQQTSNESTPSLPSSSRTASEPSEPDIQPESTPLHFPILQPPTNEDSTSSRSTTSSTNNGNGNVRDDRTEAGSQASSDSHAWPSQRNGSGNGNSMGPPTATTSRESSPAPTTMSEDSQPLSFRRSTARSPSSQGTTREGTPATEGQGQAQGQARDLESGAEEENGDGGEEEGEPAQDEKRKSVMNRATEPWLGRRWR